MIKFSLILLGGYLLYYGGNIVYDLFLKKEKVLKTDNAEEFSLGDFTELETLSPQQVSIEDVENLNMPNSFLKKEIQPDFSLDEEKPEIEDLRRRFEAEEDMDDFISVEKSSVEVVKSKFHHVEDKEATISEPEVQEIHEPKQEEVESKKTNWKDIMNLSETAVHLVANYQGYKVYQSVM